MQNQADNLDYSFEPTSQRARFLNSRMHLELADSLDHLKDNISKQLGEDIPSLDALIKKLRNGVPVRPHVFGLYYEATSALIDGNIKEGLNLLSTMANQIESLNSIEVITLSQLSLENFGLYQKLMNTDPEAPFYIISPPEEIVHDSIIRFKTALDRLRIAIPCLADEFESIVNQVVLVVGDKEKVSYDFAGGSCYMLWGALFINASLHQNEIEIIHAIAHESAHSLLFGFTINELLVTNPDEEKYTSPLRDDPRPMDGIYHSVFVLARMHYAMTQLLNSNLLTKDEEDIARKYQSIDLESFFSGYEIVKRNAKLTKMGEKLITRAYNYMDKYRV
jgi:hypothetical protein